MSKKSANTKDRRKDNREEKQGAECPFGSSQKPAGAADSEHRVEPEDEGSVADEGYQHLRLVLEPFLVAEEQKDDDHRSAYEVIVQVFLQKTEPEIVEKQDFHGILPCDFLPMPTR